MIVELDTLPVFDSLDEMLRKSNLSESGPVHRFLGGTADVFGPYKWLATPVVVKIQKQPGTEINAIQQKARENNPGALELSALLAMQTDEKNPRLISAATVGGCTALVLPYYEGETLEAKINRKTVYDLPQARQIVHSFLGEIKTYIGERRHRDLSLTNILLNETAFRDKKEQLIRILDFGASVDHATEDNHTMHTTGSRWTTPYFCRDELVGDAARPYDDGAELFSGGMDLLSLFGRRKAFHFDYEKGKAFFVDAAGNERNLMKEGIVDEKLFLEFRNELLAEIRRQYGFNNHEMRVFRRMTTPKKDKQYTNIDEVTTEYGIATSSLMKRFHYFNRDWMPLVAGLSFAVAMIALTPWMKDVDRIFRMGTEAQSAQSYAASLSKRHASPLLVNELPATIEPWELLDDVRRPILEPYLRGKSSVHIDVQPEQNDLSEYMKLEARAYLEGDTSLVSRFVYTLRGASRGMRGHPTRAQLDVDLSHNSILGIRQLAVELHPADAASREYAYERLGDSSAVVFRHIFDVINGEIDLDLYTGFNGFQAGVNRDGNIQIVPLQHDKHLDIDIKEQHILYLLREDIKLNADSALVWYSKNQYLIPWRPNIAGENRSDVLEIQTYQDGNLKRLQHVPVILDTAFRKITPGIYGLDFQETVAERYHDMSAFPIHFCAELMSVYRVQWRSGDMSQGSINPWLLESESREQLIALQPEIQEGCTEDILFAQPKLPKSVFIP